MEFMITWFWALKLLTTLIIIYICYVAFIKYKFNNKFYNTIAIILLILSIISPIKIKPTTHRVTTQQNNLISQGKELPPMKIDNSFDKATTVKHLTKEDIK